MYSRFSLPSREPTDQSMKLRSVITSLFLTTNRLEELVKESTNPLCLLGKQHTLKTRELRYGFNIFPVMVIVLESSRRETSLLSQLYSSRYNCIDKRDLRR